MSLSIIVATDRNGGIGQADELPWPRLPRDLQRLKKLTEGGIVILGRKTFQSMQRAYAASGRVMPARMYIVVTRTQNAADGRFQTVRDLDRALYALSSYGDDAFVVGGASIYEQCLVLDITTHIYLTRIDGEWDCDTFFPELDPGLWELVEEQKVDADERNASGCTFQEYSRKPRMLYYLGNARSVAQRDEMIALEAAGTCIFCPSNWSRVRGPGSKLVLHETMGWGLVENDYPYAGTQHHFLVLPRIHVTDLTELTPADWAQLQELIAWAKHQYGFTAFGLFSRNGDMHYSGATIAHLHFHIVVGDPEEGPPVVAYLSSRPGVAECFHSPALVGGDFFVLTRINSAPAPLRMSSASTSE